MHIPTYVYVYTAMHTCIYVLPQMPISCVYLCLCLLPYICLYLYLYISTYIHIHTHTYIHIYIYTNDYIYIYACVCIRVCSLHMCILGYKITVRNSGDARHRQHRRGADVVCSARAAALRPLGAGGSKGLPGFYRGVILGYSGILGLGIPCTEEFKCLIDFWCLGVCLFGRRCCPWGHYLLQPRLL